jgi:GTP-binding protein
MKNQILGHWEELPPTFVSSSESGMGRDEILDYIGTVLDGLEDNN